MSIEFKKVETAIFIADVTVMYSPTFAQGAMRSATLTLRIDGRGSIGGGGYRVDRAGMLGRIWEAIDNGEPFPTLQAAERYAERWVGACVEQGTLSPNTNSISRE